MAIPKRDKRQTVQTAQEAEEAKEVNEEVNAGADTGDDENGATKDSKPPRAPRSESLRWTDDRKRALRPTMNKLASEPGNLTAEALGKALAAHPAFEGVGHLLTVSRLNAAVRAVNKGVASLNEQDGGSRLPLPEMSYTRGPRKGGINWGDV